MSNLAGVSIPIPDGLAMPLLMACIVVVGGGWIVSAIRKVRARDERRKSELARLHAQDGGDRTLPYDQS